MLTEGDTGIIRLSEVLNARVVRYCIKDGGGGKRKEGEPGSLFPGRKMQGPGTLSVFNRERFIMICTLPAVYANSLKR